VLLWTPIPLEVVMSSTVTDLDQLDHDTSVAFIALGIARSSWDRCPSAENARAVEEAESCMNRLLDERFMVQQQPLCGGTRGGPAAPFLERQDLAARPPAVGVAVGQESAG
jgi:hypothetical protein